MLPRLLLLAGLAASASARITLREHEIRQELAQLNDGADAGFAADTPTVYWETVSLPIDYSDLSLGNFTNRYFLVDDYYRPGGPVFVFDTGESPGADQYTGHLTRSDSPFNQYLREFGAIGIVWEHRYYGKSVPWDMEIDTETPAEKMQYLTTEAALEDFDVWANQFSWKDLSVSPKQTPWVVVGGSYPGMRAAFLRHLYPETVFASYASSAPVQGQRDMSVYWEQVYRGMVNYGLTNCTQAVKAAVTHIDSQLLLPRSAAALKRQFLGRGADKNSNAGFADTLHMPFWNWQSYGVDPQLREFCAHLTAEKPKSLLLAGKHYADRWASYPEFKNIVNDNSGEDVYCEGQEQTEQEPNCLLDEKFEGAFSVAWTWQYCSEWGYFQHTNVGPTQLGSRYDDYKHQQDMCYRQFPDGVKNGLLPRQPKTEYINSVTDGWYMRPSNVFWTGGEFDPWRTLSPLSTEKWSPNFKITQDIPECGVSTAKDTIFGYMLPDAEHCYDLRTGYAKAETPRRLFAEALKGWMKCFPGREEYSVREY